MAKKRAQKLMGCQRNFKTTSTPGRRDKSGAERGKIGVLRQVYTADNDSSKGIFSMLFGGEPDHEASGTQDQNIAVSRVTLFQKRSVAESLQSP